jgi:hypothetical protein
MSTYLDVKEAVAENLGKTDGATPDTKREGAINRARRKYYSEGRWGFLTRTATLTFTAQVASLPTDFNGKFSPVCVYKYSGNVKYEFLKVPYADIGSYLTDQYAYAVDEYNGTIKINQSDATLTIDYVYLPADKTATDGSQDADIEPAPDITAITLLATAYFYLSSRQSKGSYEQFKQAYDLQLQEDQRSDAQGSPIRFFRSSALLINRGYQSR